MRKASGAIGQSDVDGALVRLVFFDAPAPSNAESGEATRSREVAVDAGGHSSQGRGAYLHATEACVRAAVQRGLARAAKARVTLDGEVVTVASLASAIVTAYERRTSALIVAARRARRLEAGAEAARAALRDGRASLVVVATDAAAAADLTEVRRAISEGRAVAFGNKVSLASLVFGSTPVPGSPAAREEASQAGLGVVAITDSRLSRAIRESNMISSALAPLRMSGSTRTPHSSTARKHGSGGAESILVEGTANLRGAARSGRKVGAPDAVE
ncbi:MAG: YlxR family protein [Polyangiaceae bacterium]